MRTDELDFQLPPELIAQEPAAKRADSRLLHYQQADRSIAHRQFSELPQILQAGDLLVFNDARVLPARFTLQKETGGIVDGLFLAQEPSGMWRVLLKNAGSISHRRLRFADAPEIAVEMVERQGGQEGGEYLLSVQCEQTSLELLERIGRMPLPPYIKRERVHDERDDLDRQRYQTVYSKQPGAVAAPTAGLHFTEALLSDLARAGVERTFVTLHVGLGTFKPVKAETLEEHAMHSEAYSISSDAAEALNRAKREGRRIVAVGTTATRVLESQPSDEPFVAKQAETSIFIYPPYVWKHVGALITNFHLPRSTLIALVAAMVGLDEQRRIYHAAIEQKYRFFSYGDAMLVEPHAT
jgi:S-adenosylmethionine:tRNA ribosyltransferase-isomerase